jgi:hypothetical protein
MLRAELKFLSGSFPLIKPLGGIRLRLKKFSRLKPKKSPQCSTTTPQYQTEHENGGTNLGEGIQLIRKPQGK